MVGFEKTMGRRDAMGHNGNVRVTVALRILHEFISQSAFCGADFKISARICFLHVAKMFREDFLVLRCHRNDICIDCFIHFLILQTSL